MTKSAPTERYSIPTDVSRRQSGRDGIDGGPTSTEPASTDRNESASV